MSGPADVPKFNPPDLQLRLASDSRFPPGHAVGGVGGDSMSGPADAPKSPELRLASNGRRSWLPDVGMASNGGGFDRTSGTHRGGFDGGRIDGDDEEADKYSSARSPDPETKQEWPVPAAAVGTDRVGRSPGPRAQHEWTAAAASVGSTQTQGHTSDGWWKYANPCCHCHQRGHDPIQCPDNPRNIKGRWRSR